jgi:hypothetical protein
MLSSRTSGEANASSEDEGERASEQVPRFYFSVSHIIRSYHSSALHAWSQFHIPKHRVLISAPPDHHSAPILGSSLLVEYYSHALTHIRNFRAPAHETSTPTPTARKGELDTPSLERDELMLCSHATMRSIIRLRHMRNQQVAYKHMKYAH